MNTSQSVIFLVRSVLYGLRGNKRGRDVNIKSSDDKRTVFKDELVNYIFFLPFFQYAILLSVNISLKQIIRY